MAYTHCVHTLIFAGHCLNTDWKHSMPHTPIHTERVFVPQNGCVSSNRRLVAMVTYQNPLPQRPSPELPIAGQHRGHFHRPALRQGNTLVTTSSAHALPIPNAPTDREITFFVLCYTSPSLIHCVTVTAHCPYLLLRYQIYPNYKYCT